MRRTNTAQWIESCNRWQIKVQKDGKRRTFYSSKPGRTGQREANAKADAWLDQGITNENTRVSVLYAEYLEHIKVSSGRSHVENTESYGRLWILPRIGRLKIKDLTTAHLQKVLDDAAVSSIANPSVGLAKKTLMNIRGTMVSFVKFCRVTKKATTLFPEGLEVARNASEGVRNILQPEHLLKLFESEETVFHGKRRFDNLIHAYRFAVLTGLRPGELLGLQWRDIVGNQVRVSRSINDMGEVTTGKNKNARRVFVMSDLAKQEILAQRQISATERVFDIRSQDEYRTKWKRYCFANNIPYVTPYELRHTFVSIVKELPEGELKAVVGHSKTMDTWGVYSHALHGDGERTAGKIQSIFEALIPDKAASK